MPSPTAWWQSALALLREDGAAGHVAALLAHEWGPRSPTGLDALADSLVAIASSYRAGDPPDRQRAARSALWAVQSAGSASRDTPYPGALEALIRVHEHAPDLRGETLLAISMLSSTEPVIDFLAEVATTGSPGGVRSAIRYLYERTGPAGRARLRRLWETDAIIHSNERNLIAAIGRLEGWGG